MSNDLKPLKWTHNIDITKEYTIDEITDVKKNTWNYLTLRKQMINIKLNY